MVTFKLFTILTYFTSASYIDLHIGIDNEGWLRTKLYDKRDDFNITIVNFLFK
jgi:hypothetical protein